MSSLSENVAIGKFGYHFLKLAIWKAKAIFVSPAESCTLDKLFEFIIKKFVCSYAVLYLLYEVMFTSCHHTVDQYGFVYSS